jgi:cell filamentation protein, protein adenylyltransferase
MAKHLDRDARRSYLGSHPWINFRVDLQRFSWRLWMLIGEANSKCQHIAGVPLRPEQAQDLYLVYLTKGVHATTSIEGNTLSEEQVRQEVENKLNLPESQQYLANEVKNIIKACKLIDKELMKDPAIKITPERICQFNAIVLKGTRIEDDVVPGKYRNHSVGVMRYRAPPWEDCRYLVNQLCDWLNGPDFVASDPQEKFMKTLLKAILAHLYLAWIHPFGDGNGRTARLIEFQILEQSGLVPYPAAHLLSNHYNKTRSQYYAELDRSNKHDQGVISFIEYATRGFVDGLHGQLHTIRDAQWRVTWENYVHDVFRDKDTASGKRQKQLVLDMPENIVPRKDLTMVSPRVAANYARKSEKTITRDINALLDMKLIIRRGKGYTPNRDLILAFLPPQLRLDAPLSS